jgi:hypothetical protein
VDAVKAARLEPPRSAVIWNQAADRPRARLPGLNIRFRATDIRFRTSARTRHPPRPLLSRG